MESIKGQPSIPPSLQGPFEKISSSTSVQDILDAVRETAGVAARTVAVVMVVIGVGCRERPSVLVEAIRGKGGVGSVRAAAVSTGFLTAWSMVRTVSVRRRPCAAAFVQL